MLYEESAVLSFATNATTTATVDTRNKRLVGVYVPTIVTGAITFNTAPVVAPGTTPGTFVQVATEAGTAYSLTAGTGGKYFAIPLQFNHCRYIQLVTAGTQVANIVFTLVFEDE